jgi:hypothetical protein
LPVGSRANATDLHQPEIRNRSPSNGGHFAGPPLTMPPTIQAGTVLINDSARKIHAAGWNFLFIAPEVKVMFFGAIGAKKVQNALIRILAKVKRQSFNSLEVTGIVAKHFFGVPYAIVSAHSRHIQQGRRLEDVNARRASQFANKWAAG